MANNNKHLRRLEREYLARTYVGLVPAGRRGPARERLELCNYHDCGKTPIGLS